MNLEAAFWWMVFNFIAIIFSAFYSMMEMACVSFNKVRLHYFVSKKNKRALWLQDLLQHPTKLFGTTLIGVNLANVISSECGREFYASIGLSPDLAPLTQVALVLIFGELAPMFAARTYPENVGMLGVPFLYASAVVMTPLLWIVRGITKLCQLVTGGREENANIFLSQDELQKILEEQEDLPSDTESEDFNIISSNIFTLRMKTAQQIMQPLKTVPMLPSNATVAQMHNLMLEHDINYVPIFHQNKANIIGIALPRDLIRPPVTRRIRDYAKHPWFVTKHTQIMQILQQFRRNNQTVAVILDEHGQAVGIVDLDHVINEIFGKAKAIFPRKEMAQQVIERTFPGEMKVAEFNRQFNVILDPREEMSLVQVMVEELGHDPLAGDSVDLGPFTLTVKETSLLEVKSVTIISKL